jgi:acyl-CoA thioesterase
VLFPREGHADEPVRYTVDRHREGGTFASLAGVPAVDQDGGGRPRPGAALAAHATDLTLIGTALRAVPDVSQADAQKAFASAVTSHTVWFHRPLRTDAWPLLRQQGPILARGLS